MCKVKSLRKIAHLTVNMKEGELLVLCTLCPPLDVQFCFPEVADSLFYYSLQDLYSFSQQSECLDIPLIQTHKYH